MDAQFLDFLAKVLKNAADGQQQLDEAIQWMTRGLTGVGEMTTLFRQIYGLEKINEKSPAMGNYGSRPRVLSGVLKGIFGFFRRSSGKRIFLCAGKVRGTKRKIEIPGRDDQEFTHPS